MRWPTASYGLAVGGAVLASLFASGDVEACGRGISYGFGGGDIGVLAGGALALTDLVFLGYDMNHAPPSKGPSETWSKTEAWVQTPQAVLMGIVTPMFPIEEVPTSFAFTVLPTTLAAHGLYGANATWGDRWQIPVGVVGALDVGLVAYDVGAAIAGTRPDELYALGEILAASPQVLFGLAFASGVSGRTLGTSLALAALPTVLVAHGITVLVVASHADAEPTKAATRPVKAAPPRFSFTPMTTPGTIGLAGFGSF